MSGVDEAQDEEIVDPEIRRFVAYWRGKRGAAKYPARAALDPSEFRYVLGDVVLVEARRAPPESAPPWRFRYRLIGSNIVARDGYDLTNKTLDEMPEPEYRERVRKTWTKVCETGIAAHYVRDLVLDNRSRSYEVVVLPLASDGQEIDMLVSVQRETRPDLRQEPR